MRNLCSAVLLAAVVLLATTCGTVRAIQGDFESKAPRLIALAPTQTVSGQFVQFGADVVDLTGDNNPADDDEQEELGRVGDVLYFWDFGGGAEPNTSILPRPNVQIRDGQRGPYEGSLTLTDGSRGESETYEFTLFVTELGVAAVTPGTGIAGGTGQFSAVVASGNVQTYSWDFGGAATPGGSNAPSPSVTFTSTPGTYEARVFVSNNFESVEFPFTIEVLPAAEEPTE